MTATTNEIVATHDLLALAASLLPEVVDSVPNLSVDVHVAATEAALRLGAVGQADAHGLADHAESHLAAYLVKFGKTKALRCERCTLRGWLIFCDITAVTDGLEAAAGYYRLQRLAAVLGANEFSAYLLHQLYSDG